MSLLIKVFCHKSLLMYSMKRRGSSFQEKGGDVIQAGGRDESRSSERRESHWMEERRWFILLVFAWLYNHIQQHGEWELVGCMWMFLINVHQSSSYFYSFFFFFEQCGSFLHSGQNHFLHLGGSVSFRHLKWNHLYGHVELSQAIIFPLSGPSQ